LLQQHEIALQPASAAAIRLKFALHVNPCKLAAVVAALSSCTQLLIFLHSSLVNLE
jgi:hypothetical protein